MTGGDTLSFRYAGEEDIPAIVKLLADDGLGKTRERPGEPLDPKYLEGFRAMTAQGGNQTLLAIKDREVVGCLQLTFIAGLSRLGTLRAQIEAVRVRGDQRGSGVGRLLMEEALKRAREAGCSLVQLTTDKKRGDAHRFYESLGNNPSHIGMKLELKSED
ncbi:MAG: GNAT family N-acetyltransferase [Limibacillus sp.]